MAINGLSNNEVIVKTKIFQSIIQKKKLLSVSNQIEMYTITLAIFFKFYNQLELKLIKKNGKLLKNLAINNV